MKSSRKRKVTAAFFAAAALGGVAHAAPTLNMNDLVGSNTTTESTAQGNNNIATPVVRPMATQPTPVTTQSVPKVTPLIPRVRPVPVNDIAKALSDQQRAVSQPQYVVNKQTNAVMEPTLAMHSLMNVQRKTEPITVQKQVDGKQQVQTTQVQRTPVMVQQESTTPLVIANTTQTKAVVAKQKLTIRDIQRAEREQLAQLAAEEAAQQAGTNQVDQQMVAQKQAEAQRQAAILAEQQRQTAMQAEQQRIAQQQAEAQRQAALQAEQQRIAEQQAEAQRQAAMQAEQQRIAQQQAEAQRQAALRAEQERIAAQQAEQARIAEAQRQAAEQERLRIQEEQRRIAQQQAEAQRQAAMQAEQQRIAQQQAEAQRQAALKAEQDRIVAQQAEAQRQAALQAEQQRIAAEQAEAQRQAALQAEQERIAAEQAEAQRQAALKAEQDRIAAQQAEQQRIAAEQAEAQRQAALQAEQQRIAAEQAEAQRQAALKAEQQRMAAEQAEAQRQAALKAEQERIAAEQAEAQRQAALKAEQQRIAAEQAARQRAEAAAKAEAERQAAIKAEQDRIAAEQAEAQRQATLKAEQDRIAAEQAKAEREAALKAEQDRIAAQQAEMARQAAIKEEQERLAAEQLAKEEAESAAKAQAEAEPKAKAQAEAAAKAQAEAEAKAKAQAEAAAKAQAEAEAKAKAEAEAQAKAKENKLPQSYVDARNEASTKGSGVTEEKNILSQPIEPPLQADTSAKISLAFDVKNYESMSTTVDNKEIKYRAFEYIPYVANPIDIDQQYMNIYVPEEYFNNGTINGYNTQTAPIFMPNAVGGYMPSQAMTPKVENGKPNSVLYALSRGYVVASPATRGRTNKASDGNFIGKAPAVIVDLQAATAYLHANDSTMPGNANRIITNGTSAGGAVSLLQGATGNNSDFQPYLQALGAATAATNVYAVSAYAPITNLDAADMAYEWSYKGITSFNKVMGQGELPQANVGGNTAPPQRTMQRVNLNADDVAYSNLLSEHFPEYVNNLQLHDSMGRVLKLDKNGNGTFKNYVKAFIIDAANKAQAKGTDLSKHTYLVRDNKTGAIKDINWEAYNQFVSRSKAPGAFDSRSNDSGENNLFGTSATDNNHFTITAALHDTTPNQDVYVENAKIVTMMNPMNYLGSPAATNARYYRIRYGTTDSNTSVAIPLIVGTRAQNLGYNVDMATPFDVDHSGDYDLDELFNWMDNIVKNGR